MALSLSFYRVIIMKTILNFISIFMLLMTINQAQSHSLKENSAQVIMRDGQVEIRLSVNMARWQTLLQNNQAWLLGDIPQVMPKQLSETQKTAFLSELISQNTQVSVNDSPLKMAILSFPELPHTEYKNKDDHHHDEYSEIVLTAQHQQGHVNHISLALPKSLGNVHSRFVQPSYRLLKAGSKTQLSFKRHLMANNKPK